MIRSGMNSMLQMTTRQILLSVDNGHLGLIFTTGECIKVSLGINSPVLSSFGDLRMGRIGPLQRYCCSIPQPNKKKTKHWLVIWHEFLSLIGK